MAPSAMPGSGHWSRPISTGGSWPWTGPDRVSRPRSTSGAWVFGASRWSGSIRSSRPSGARCRSSGHRPAGTLRCCTPFSNLVADADRIPVDVLEADLAAASLPGAAQSAHEFCRVLLNPVTGVRKELRLTDQELGALTVPVHVVWGSADNFVEPGAALSRFQGVATVTTEIIDGGNGVGPEAA